MCFEYVGKSVCVRETVRACAGVRVRVCVCICVCMLRYCAFVHVCVPLFDAVCCDAGGGTD